MPTTRLAPDFRERLARQAEGQIDPSEFTGFLPPTTTTTQPVGFPTTSKQDLTSQAAAPTGPMSPLGRAGAQVKALMSQQSAPASTGSAGAAPSGPVDLSSVANPQREQFMEEGNPGFGDKFDAGLKTLSTPGGVLNPQAAEGKLQLTEDGAATYLQAKMNRVVQIAKLAGAPDEQVRALREQMAYDLQQTPRVNAETGEDLTTDEWVTLAEGVINGQEATYAQSVIDGTPVVGAEEEYAYDPKQIAYLQAWSAGLMKPYTDKLMASGQTDVAAAYQQQAQLAPLWQAVQDREALARQLQAAQNQIASQQSGTSSSLTPEEIAAALGGG